MDPQSIVSEQSFNHIYSTFQAAIYHYVYRLVRNRELAEDLTEETFVRAFRVLPKLNTATLNVSSGCTRPRPTVSLMPFVGASSSHSLPLQQANLEPADVESADPQEAYGTTALVCAALQRMSAPYEAA